MNRLSDLLLEVNFVSSNPVSVRISLESLEKGPVHLEGGLPKELLEVSGEPRVEPETGVMYVIDVQRLGDEILVQGRVEAELRLECARSGAFFSTLLGDSAFLRAYPIQDCSAGLELAEDLREAVVLEIPAFPVDPAVGDAPIALAGMTDDMPEDDESNPSPWNSLDALDLTSEDDADESSHPESKN